MCFPVSGKLLIKLKHDGLTIKFFCLLQVLLKFLTSNLLNEHQSQPPLIVFLLLLVLFVVHVNFSKSVHYSKSETTKVDLSAMEVDPAGGSDRDRGARRPRRYITPGDSRMSERFRTQPITSAERLESDRYGGALLGGI